MCIGGSRGGVMAHAPRRVQILLFWHTKFSKRNLLGSPGPPYEVHTPLREILDPPLTYVTMTPNIRQQNQPCMLFDSLQNWIWKYLEYYPSTLVRVTPTFTTTCERSCILGMYHGASVQQLLLRTWSCESGLSWSASRNAIDSFTPNNNTSQLWDKNPENNQIQATYQF